MKLLMILLLVVIGAYLLARFVIRREGGRLGATPDPADPAADEPPGAPRDVARLPTVTAPAAAAGATAPETAARTAPGAAAERAVAVDAGPERARSPRAAAPREEASGDLVRREPARGAAGRPPAPETVRDQETGEAVGVAPERLDRPDQADDLKRISGIGPTIERTLNDLGIYRFAQIAAFTPENIVWVDRHLRFKGRIEREEWVGQARTLIAERESLGAGAERPRQGATGPLH